MFKGAERKIKPGHTAGDRLGCDKTEVYENPARLRSADFEQLKTKFIRAVCVIIKKQPCELPAWNNISVRRRLQRLQSSP